MPRLCRNKGRRGAKSLGSRQVLLLQVRQRRARRSAWTYNRHTHVKGSHFTIESSVRWAVGGSGVVQSVLISMERGAADAVRPIVAGRWRLPLGPHEIWDPRLDPGARSPGCRAELTADLGATPMRLSYEANAPSADQTRRRQRVHSRFGFFGWLREDEFEARLKNHPALAL